MKSLLVVLSSLIHDESVCCKPTYRKRDMETISHRTKHEGISFLTITLPSFCSDLDQALAVGQVQTQHFQSFRKRRGLPVFLRGFLLHVFREDGTLLEHPSAEAIQLLRQITRLCKKIELPCAFKRVRAELQKFARVDRELTCPDYQDERALYMKVLTYHIGDIFLDIGRKVDNLEIVPKHGPGATAVTQYSNEKWQLYNWSERLDAVFPYDHYGIVNHNAITDLMEDVTIHKPETEEPSRVEFVFKDLEKPRIISIEPEYNQFVQQGLKDELYDLIESHPILAGQVNFTDQSINQDLAKESSIHGLMATLDLSDASNRVLLSLVEFLFSHFSSFYGAIMACRSSQARISLEGFDDEVVTLKKFAPMGSALCFPIEALCFFIISTAAIMRSRGLKPSRHNFALVAKEVFVYGDDIIVPVDEVDVVREDLEFFKLKVNLNKSFWTGKFRESCGADYYDGNWVTPVYCRSEPPDKKSPTTIESWVSFANQLFDSGYWSAARAARRIVEKAVGHGLPTAHRHCSGLAWSTFLPLRTYGGKKMRWNTDLHKPEVKTIVLRGRCRTDPISGYHALHKVLTMGFKQPQGDTLMTLLRPRGLEEDHLQYSSVRGTPTVTYRWVPATP